MERDGSFLRIGEFVAHSLRKKDRTKRVFSPLFSKRHGGKFNDQALPMVNDAEILIFQSMQLSLVFFLILFSFNSKLAGTSGKSRSLRLLGVGFILNFSYLIVKVWTYLQHAGIPTTINPLTYHLTLCFDLATSVIFLYGAFVMEHGIDNVPRPDVWVAISSDRRLRLKGIMVALIAFLIGWLNWQPKEDYDVWFYFYDFLSYGITSFLLYKHLRIETLTNTKEANRFLFYGFLGWTVLQLLSPVLSAILPRDNSYIKDAEFAGFSLSFVSKSLILYGLYNMSVRIGKYASFKMESQARKLEGQTREMEGQAKELRELNVRLREKEAERENRVVLLENNSERLRKLHKLIEEIYSLKENESVVSKMLTHMLYEPIFGFDYVIYSEVDKFQERIIHRKGHAHKKEDSLIEKPEEWVRDNGFALSHHDIMVQTMRTDKVFRVKGNVVNGEEVDLDHPECILDSDIYRRYSHDKLDRVFIPISDRDRSGETIQDPANGAQNEIIGIVELGFHTGGGAYSENSISERLAELLIYLTNFAKSYLRNRGIEETQAIRREVEMLEKSSSHLEFIKQVLKKGAIEIGADSGDISFLSLDNTQFWLDECLTYGDVKIEDLNEVRSRNARSENPRLGIFRYAVQEKKPYYSNDVATDPYYIHGLEKVQSQLSVPLIYSGTVLGVISYFSARKGHFNDLKSQYIFKLASRSIEVFLRLKLASAVSNLVIPYSMYDHDRIYESTCESIRKYYACRAMAIWEGNEEGNHIYRAIYVTEKSGLRQRPDLMRLHDLTADVSSYAEPRIVIPGEDNSRPANSLEVYVKDAFDSMIYVPLGKNRGVSRFITLFSKVRLECLFPEDKTFLSQISAKFNLSLNYADLFEFFDKITSESYNRPKEVILEEFTQYIKKISGADILLLFLYDPGQRKFVGSITPKGNLQDDRLLGRLNVAEIEPNDFSYSIIENDTQWLENEEQYRNYRRNLAEWKGWGVFEKDFWYRERIKSLAAVRVEFKNIPLGVLFFNFREEQQFFDTRPGGAKRRKAHPENQPLINLLSNLIGRVIKISNTLEEERLFMERKTTETFMMARSEVAIGMIHNIKGIHSDISFKLDIHRRTVEKGLGKPEVMTSLEHLRESILRFMSDYLLYREYLILGHFKIEPCQAAEIFLAVHRLLHYQNSESDPDGKNSIKVEMPNGKLIIHCDRVLFTHVLLNLIRNAVQADARTVKVRVMDSDSTNSFSVVEVQDDGHGIKDEYKTRIFKPNFTTKKDGTGMGLAVCKNVMEMHGGRIDFQSVYNKNKRSFTTFSIYIPILK